MKRSKKEKSTGERNYFAYCVFDNVDGREVITLLPARGNSYEEARREALIEAGKFHFWHPGTPVALFLEDRCVSATLPLERQIAEARRRTSDLIFTIEGTNPYEYRWPKGRAPDFETFGEGFDPTMRSWVIARPALNARFRQMTDASTGRDSLRDAIKALTSEVEEIVKRERSVVRVDRHSVMEFVGGHGGPTDIGDVS